MTGPALLSPEQDSKPEICYSNIAAIRAEQAIAAETEPVATFGFSATPPAQTESDPPRTVVWPRIPHVSRVDGTSRSTDSIVCVA